MYSRIICGLLKSWLPLAVAYTTVQPTVWHKTVPAFLFPIYQFAVANNWYINYIAIIFIYIYNAIYLLLTVWLSAFFIGTFVKICFWFCSFEISEFNFGLGAGSRKNIKSKISFVFLKMLERLPESCQVSDDLWHKKAEKQRFIIIQDLLKSILKYG